MFEDFFIVTINNDIQDSFATPFKYGIDYAINILAPKDGDCVTVFKVQAATFKHALTYLSKVESLTKVTEFIYKK